MSNACQLSVCLDFITARCSFSWSWILIEYHCFASIMMTMISLYGRTQTKMKLVIWRDWQKTQINNCWNKPICATMHHLLIQATMAYMRWDLQLIAFNEVLMRLSYIMRILFKIIFINFFPFRIRKSFRSIKTWYIKEIRRNFMNTLHFSPFII